MDFNRTRKESDSDLVDGLEKDKMVNRLESGI